MSAVAEHSKSREGRRETGPAILARALRCHYGEHEALRGIDLEVERGEIFALLGPNGAGKTSTVEILEGFRTRSGGDALVLGADPATAGPEWRGRIGVVLQESLPEPELTVRECMSLYAGFYRRPLDVPATIEMVGLGEAKATRCEQLSGGQRRRLDVALALIGDPELLFVDEPTTGFDPAGRRAAWELLRELRDAGKTILLTTHLMEEAEALADRIAILSRGEIVASGTPGSLGERDALETSISFTLPETIRIEELPPSLDARRCASGAGVIVRTATPVRALAALTGWALERDLELADLEARRPSLEQVYLDLTSEVRR